MALPIRDGNQTLTTLSTIIVNSAHVPAHSVVSLGSQAITDIATAVSGVELGPNTISALENISVTFGAGTSVTIGNVVSVTGGLTDAELRASSVTIGGSVQVSNFPATQSVTFSSPTITGSVSVLNLPATQAVTFTQAPVTFGNIAGSVTAVISGTPSVTFTQASVTFTQASVTFGQAVVSASNIGDLLSSVATDNTLDATTKFVKIGGHQSGSNQTAHIVHVSAGGSMSVDASGSSVTFTQASVTFNSITGSVSVLNLPATQTTTFSAITGSVSVLNLPATQTVTFTQASVTFGTPVVTGSVSVLNFPATQTIAGTVTASATILNSAPDYIKVIAEASDLPLGTYYLQRTGETIWESRTTENVSIYYDNGWHCTENANNNDIANAPADRNNIPPLTGWTLGTDGISFSISYENPLKRQIFGTVTVGNSVTIGSLPAISGTVTVGGFSTVSVGGSIGGLVISGRRDGFAENILLDTGTGILQAIPQVPNGIGGYANVSDALPLPVKGSVTANLSSTNLNSVTIGVRGSVTASIENSVTIASLPAISGTVTVANIQGASVNLLNFNSTTASTTIVSANSSRKFLTIFNEGAGTLHISAGATATTASYQVRLLAGAYWECPNAQASLTHSGQFASSGTARVTEII